MSYQEKFQRDQLPIAMRGTIIDVNSDSSSFSVQLLQRSYTLDNVPNAITGNPHLKIGDRVIIFTPNGAWNNAEIGGMG